MKKICAGILALLLGLFSGCSAMQNTPTTTTAPPANGGVQELPQGLILLDISGGSLDTSVRYSRNAWLESFGSNDYHIRLTYDRNEENLPLIYYLRNRETGAETPVTIPRWSVAAGSHVVLQDRYYFEWLAEATDDSKIVLIRVDGVTGEVKVVDTVSSVSPFIYLSKLDDDHFTSSSLVPAPEAEGNEIQITAVRIYDAEGNGREIIREEYRCSEENPTSIGRHLENVCAMDGKVYGYGREYVDHVPEYCLYTYSEEGAFERREPLPGVNEIIGEEQAVQFWIVGEYILVRTWESLTSYIIKRGEGAAELLMKGEQNENLLTFSDSITRSEDVEYLFYVADFQVEDIPAFQPLKAIEVSSGEIKSVSLRPNEDYPYMIDFRMASNGDLVFQYEARWDSPLSGMYAQYAVPKETLREMLLAADA